MIPPSFEYLAPKTIPDAVALLQKHGDEAKIIRCEIISTEEARVTYEKTKPKDIFEKCEDGFCPMPTPQTQEVS